MRLHARVCVRTCVYTRRLVCVHVHKSVHYQYKFHTALPLLLLSQLRTAPPMPLALQ